MDEATKERLKQYKTYDKCEKCGGKRSRNNPLDKCCECKKRFCFDHLYGGALKTKNPNEPIKTVCESCFDSLGYRSS